MEEKPTQQTGGILDERNPRVSLVNLAILFSTIAGFILFGYAIKNRIESAYYPIASVISVALGGVAIKAHKKTS